MAGLTKLDCDNERLWFVCQLCLCCECRVTVSPWALSGFIIAALCCASMRECKLLCSKAHLLCIYIMMSMFFFLLLLAGLRFHQFVSWFHGPERMCICELWWKLYNSSAFDCKASVDIFEMSEPALSTHTTTKPRNNDTRLLLFHPDGFKERTNIYQYVWHESLHIFTSAFVQDLLVGIFALRELKSEICSSYTLRRKGSYLEPSIQNPF